jgi:hypothetical protein
MGSVHIVAIGLAKTCNSRIACVVIAVAVCTGCKTGHGTGGFLGFDSVESPCLPCGIRMGLVTVVTERFVTEPVVDLVAGRADVGLCSGKSFMVLGGVAVRIKGPAGYKLRSTLVKVAGKTVIARWYVRLRWVMAGKALCGIACIFTAVKQGSILVQPGIGMKARSIGMATPATVGGREAGNVCYTP